MEKIDIAIIGAGAVGLAVASEVCRLGREVYIFEKNDSFGRETSERNSQVIHAGLYYPKDSLQARLCAEGREMIYDISRRYGVPTKKIGKLVVAKDDSEISELEGIFRTAADNGVPGLRILDSKEINLIEPDINAVAAIFSPETGIMSAPHLMRYFLSKAKDSAGADPLILRNEVVGIKRSGDVYRLTVQERDGNKYNFDSRIVINCGGLHSDKNAINAGIDIDRSGYRLFFCKGEYFRVSSKHTGRINHLIYPVPAHAGLGVHVTLELDGSMKLGPNTIWLPGNVFDYSVDDSHRKEFFEAAKEYLPFLDIEDLQPDQAGIRPKLFGPGMAKRDFVISEESSKGLPGLINLIGIESPGLTASPAIGKYVREIVDEIL